MSAYYNEIDPFCAQWLRNLMAADLIPAGEVDERSIADVSPDDLRGFGQCHFFAGIGGWAYAARLAGWPDDRELWTGSCPCQPFSTAGKQRGTDDERHLWPHQFRLLRACRPAVWMGEQVAAAVGKGWLDGVLADLESIGYAGRAVAVPACAVNAPHRRDRLWLVAHTVGAGRGQARLQGSGNLEAHSRQARDWVSNASQAENGSMADAMREGSQIGSGYTGMVGDEIGRPEREAAAHDCRCSDGSFWENSERIIGHDRKTRRAEPSIRLLAHGIPARVGRLRAYGNAIVPQVAAQAIAAYMEAPV